MRPKFKRFVAALIGAATLVSPATAFADDGPCKTYEQVESESGGGEQVGGLLIYETEATVSRSTPTTTTTTSTSTTASAGIPGGPSAGTTVTVTETSTQPGTVTTSQEPVGYYAMNDGSVYQINCLTGQEQQVKPPSN